ncbi:hypothetical protein [Methylorubrum extorquens]|uniref:hypothetical protein n=1 Tax=Methylorubrum extorquens TaxID=408 RepID=UPI002237E355|nr:hypothetical protein [Methylorubrum extorquens]UYW34482.1 hypothetical protein OKB92_10490 [Methylorubrum extorquens]
MLWTAVTAQGGITSGSTSFDSLEACSAGQKAMGSVTVDAARGFSAAANLESLCVNSATGERKSVIAPRTR